MPVRRRFFQEAGETPADAFSPHGGSSQQSARPPQGSQGAMPAPPPPPIDPSQAAATGFGRGPTMPGNVQDLLTPQQGMGQGTDQMPMDNPMAGSSSVVLRLLKQLGHI